MLTKIPVTMVRSSGDEGSSVVVKNGKLATSSEAVDTTSEIEAGFYDQGSGILTLTFASGNEIAITGFPTFDSIPQGQQGPQGEAGEDGRDGQVGLPGPAGCAGPMGPRGLQGKKGERGDVGPTGPTGATGPTGPRGEQGPAGNINIVISSTDPGSSIGPGSIWVNPDIGQYDDDLDQF